MEPSLQKPKQLSFAGDFGAVDNVAVGVEDVSRVSCPLMLAGGPIRILCHITPLCSARPSGTILR
jgi:hypothetical protein